MKALTYRSKKGGDQGTGSTTAPNGETSTAKKRKAEDSVQLQISKKNIHLKFKKKYMPNYSNEQKAKMYNQLLFQYQKLQEEVRLIKAENLNVSDNDQIRINELERKMKQVYNETKKLYV